MKKKTKKPSVSPPTTTYDGTTHTHTVGEIQAHIQIHSSHAILFLFPRVFLSRCSPTLARVLIIRIFFFFFTYFLATLLLSRYAYTCLPISRSTTAAAASLVHYCYDSLSLDSTLCTLPNLYPSYTVNSYVIIIIIITHIILLYTRGETVERSRKTTTRPRSYITQYIYIIYTSSYNIICTHGCSRPRGPVITPPIPVRSSRASWAVFTMQHSLWYILLLLYNIKDRARAGL